MSYDEEKAEHGGMLRVTFDTSNAAFGWNPGLEAAEVLRKVAARMDGGPIDPGILDTILDANGNTIGTVTFEAAS